MKRSIAVVAMIGLGIAGFLFFTKTPEPAPGFTDTVPNKPSSPDFTPPRPEVAGPSPLAVPEQPVATAGVTPVLPPKTVVPPDQPPASPILPMQAANVVAAVSAPAVSPLAPDSAASVDVDKVRLMLRDYRTIYHENPVGTNADIMRAIMGGNPKQARLGPPEGQSLSAEGELLDRWGTPYFFHQLAADSMEIRSAGPDKVLWTSDDVITR